MKRKITGNVDSSRKEKDLLLCSLLTLDESLSAEKTSSIKQGVSETMIHVKAQTKRISPRGSNQVRSKTTIGKEGEFAFEISGGRKREVNPESSFRGKTPTTARDALGKKSREGNQIKKWRKR